MPTGIEIEFKKKKKKETRAGSAQARGPRSARPGTTSRLGAREGRCAKLRAGEENNEIQYNTDATVVFLVYNTLSENNSDNNILVFYVSVDVATRDGPYAEERSP